MTKDEMVGWHHRLDRHEFEKTPGVGEGQGRLVCCSPSDCRESDMTEGLNSNPYSCLETSKDRGTWWVTVHWT